MIYTLLFFIIHTHVGRAITHWCQMIYSAAPLGRFVLALPATSSAFKVVMGRGRALAMGEILYPAGQSYAAADVYLASGYLLALCDALNSGDLAGSGHHACAPQVYSKLQQSVLNNYHHQRVLLR